MMAISTGQRVGRQDLDKSARMGSRALDLIGTLVMSSWTGLGVRTGNSEKVEFAIDSAKDTVGLR